MLPITKDAKHKELIERYLGELKAGDVELLMRLADGGQIKVEVASPGRR